MKSRVLVGVGLLALSFSAAATDGYFSHGYGMKAKGRAGVSMAMTDDAFGGANNPATMVWAGRRLDVGIEWFSPQRSAERTGTSAFGPFSIDGQADSDSTNFFVPEIAYNHMLSPTLSLGVSVYGNGGMNTDYPSGQLPAGGACAGFNPIPGPYNLLCGNGKLGVNLSQLLIAPTLAWKFHPDHSVGIAPLIGYQRFSAEGLQAFDNPFASTSPGSVTNRGTDSAWGFGVRIGYYGQITPQIGVGAAYSTKVSMQDFDKYKGLFADQGGFDMPENFGLGVSFKPVPQLTVGVDYKRINYRKVDSVGNPSNLILNCFGGSAANCLGGGAGAGFGWHDVNVWKVGADWRVNQAWTVRIGYGHTDNPIRASDVTFNILAPGVVQDHFTLGATYAWGVNHEITAAYMHAFSNDVTGQSLFVPISGGMFPATTTEKIKMYENSLGVAYSYKF
ncbi:MAG: outer membrane protein transport protein [Burkholderiales bacterium]|nr:outer membrane protein transport protein [Burkholderiales bacterium]